MNLIFDDTINIEALGNFATITMAKEGGVAIEGGKEVGMSGEYMGEIPMEGTVKDPLLSSWPAVIGISAATIILGLFLGVLLAKKKIKKGIELYED